MARITSKATGTKFECEQSWKSLTLRGVRKLLLFFYYYSSTALGCSFSFMMPYTDTQAVGVLGRRISQWQHTQTFKPRVGFEPTTPLFKREKILQTSDRAAPVNSKRGSCYSKMKPGSST
jgi:hypothetical protein